MRKSNLIIHSLCFIWIKLFDSLQNWLDLHWRFFKTVDEDLFSLATSGRSERWSWEERDTTFKEKFWLLFAICWDHIVFTNWCYSPKWTEKFASILSASILIASRHQVKLKRWSWRSGWLLSVELLFWRECGKQKRIHKIRRVWKVENEKSEKVWSGHSQDRWAAAELYKRNATASLEHNEVRNAVRRERRQE